jgi:hypothetical protein
MNDMLADMRAKMEALRAKKRILVTGRAIPQQPDRCTGQQLVQGFKEAGHDAYFFGCFYGQPTNFLGSKECQSMDRWDLVVSTEMNDGMAGYEMLFEYHKLKDVPKLYWDFDVSYNEAYAYQRAGSYRYDGYLVGNKLYVEKFAEKFRKPALHLPYACSPVIHRRKSDVVKTDVVGFVGNMTPEREAMLGDIKCITGVFGEALIDATNRLGIMVHVNQNACKGLVPGRPWETAGCGTNLLMDRASYDDFKEFIPQELLGIAVVPFDTKEDIKAHLRPHLDFIPNMAKLEAEGRALMNYMHTNHAYKHRAETILKWAKEQGILK